MIMKVTKTNLKEVVIVKRAKVRMRMMRKPEMRTKMKGIDTHLMMMKRIWKEIHRKKVIMRSMESLKWVLIMRKKRKEEKKKKGMVSKKEKKKKVKKMEKKTRKVLMRKRKKNKMRMVNKVKQVNKKGTRIRPMKEKKKKRERNSNSMLLKVKKSNRIRKKMKKKVLKTMSNSMVNNNKVQMMRTMRMRGTLKMKVRKVSLRLSIKKRLLRMKEMKVMMMVVITDKRAIRIIMMMKKMRILENLNKKPPIPDLQAKTQGSEDHVNKAKVEVKGLRRMPNPKVQEATSQPKRDIQLKDPLQSTSKKRINSVVAALEEVLIIKLLRRRAKNSIWKVPC